MGTESPIVDIMTQRTDAGVPTRASRNHYLRLAALGLFVGTMSFTAWALGAKDWVNPGAVAELLKNFGIFAPVFYMLLMACAVVISPIPSLPLDAAAGAVFGPLLGTLYSVIGAEGGAVISFLIGRGLGREAIARLLKRDIGFCDLCSERHLIKVIFIARLFPIFSFDLISYGAGLTRMSLRGFALATLLGMIPPTFVLNYFGTGIFSGSGTALILGGVMVAAFFWVPRWIKRRNPWGIYNRLEQHTEYRDRSLGVR